MISTLLLLLACGDDTTTSDTGSVTATDSGDVTSDSGTTDVTGDSGEPTDTEPTDTEPTDTEPPKPEVDWTFDDVFGVPNLDDDDGNRTTDYSDDGGWSGVSGENDLATFTIAKDTIDSLPAGETVRLTLSGETNKIRIHKSSGQILGQNSDTTYEFSPAGEVTLKVEFRDLLTQGYLELERLDSSGASVESAEVLLMASPLLMGHHLQEAEEVWVVAVDYFGTDNDDMIQDFHDHVGSAFTEVNGQSYGWDVWIQDEFEWGNLHGTDTRIGVLLNLIRDRGIDAYASEMLTDDRYEVVYGSGRTTSQDYGGNLETSPPVTVGGTDYPFGRWYYGDDNSLDPNDDIIAAIESNILQDPFTQSIKFLCVGHVDEYHTFIPDKASTKGFKLVVADVDAGYALLDSLNGNSQISKYQAKGFRTIEDITGDNAIRALNEDIRDDYIEPNIDIFKTELGLTESDIIRVPGLFEEVRGCGNTTAALMPGTVNLTVANVAGEAVKLIAPDPFLRQNQNDQSSDPLIAEWNSLMPASVETVFVDDWDIYHMALGEVHCGSKVQRAPNEDWWDTSLDLLEGN